METKELEISENQAFQVFDLDSIAMRRRSSVEEIREINLNARKTLKEKLEKIGYIVLESQEFKHGVPESIILVREVSSERDIEADFFKIVNDLGLQFRPSRCYFLKPP